MSKNYGARVHRTWSNKFHETVAFVYTNCGNGVIRTHPITGPRGGVSNHYEVVDAERESTIGWAENWKRAVLMVMTGR